MKRVCVFCGSSMGTRADYAEAAAGLGRLLASRGLGLVYGGGNVGLMGIMADAALAAGGEVVGVIPEALLKLEVGHLDLAQLHVVGSMHERKALMAELSDGFVALPGGMGTLEELAEVLTWAQLGLHARPVGLLDVGGYYRPLIAFFDQAVAAGFLRPAHRAILQVAVEPEAMLDRLAAWSPAAPVEQVIDRASS